MRGMGWARAQAALFDGIMFLLISSMSVGIMYSFMVAYGDSQDRVMRSAHVLNYVQSVMKSIYFMDASTLENVDPIKVGGSVVADCSKLGQWKGTITVADMVKKDLANPGPFTQDFTTWGLFDDKYGAADAPGKTALWCLLNEVMKPFSQAGYKYLAEALNGKLLQTYPSTATTVITDSALVQNNPRLFPRGQPLCELVSDYFKESITVASPFRILVETQAGPTPGPQTVQYMLRVCVWPSNETMT